MPWLIGFGRDEIAGPRPIIGAWLLGMEEHTELEDNHGKLLDVRHFSRSIGWLNAGKRVVWKVANWFGHEGSRTVPRPYMYMKFEPDDSKCQIVFHAQGLLQRLS